MSPLHSDTRNMLHEIFNWAFHWVLLWLAFELGRRWNEKDVAASIAAITETNSRRWSQEVYETPEKVDPEDEYANHRSDGYHEVRLQVPRLPVLHLRQKRNGDCRDLCR